MKNLTIKAINPNYHNPENVNTFREQIAVLYVGDVDREHVTLIRSYINVGLNDQVGFDPQKPGTSTNTGWKILHDMVLKDDVRGTFHTHPVGHFAFSEHDYQTMKALAMTYGKRMMWHGVQALNSQHAAFVAMQMIGKNIFCYDYTIFSSKPEDKIIRLPLPPYIRYEEKNGIFVTRVEHQLPG